MNSPAQLSVTLLAEDHDFKVTAFRTGYEFQENRPQKFRKANPNSHLILISGNKHMVMAFNKHHFNKFDCLIKSQIDEQRKQALLRKGLADRELLVKSYRISVFNHALAAIGIPILLWLILETFFRLSF
jgi:hypothetical protein